MHKLDCYDEVALVKELQQGNSEAFILLYNRYHPALYAYIIRLIKVPETAEDILQEVFLKIWTIREKIKPDLSFQAYLYRISRNRVFKALKKIATDNELRLRVMYELGTSCEDAGSKTSWDQYEKLLRSAVNQLSPQRQKVFRLCREEGKTYKEVSVELSISTNTVKEHMVLATRSIWDYISRAGIIFFLTATLFSLSGIIYCR